jgi:hypothetical protein
MTSKRDIEKRLKEIESAVKEQTQSDIWINIKDNVVKIMRMSTGLWDEPREFESVHEAGRWVEKQIDQAPGGRIGGVIHNICDLYKDSEALKAAVADVFGPDDLPCGFFNGIKTGGPADIKLWALANSMTERTVWKFFDGACTREDFKILDAYHTIFSWERDEELTESIKLFIKLIKQIGAPYVRHA